MKKYYGNLADIKQGLGQIEAFPDSDRTINETLARILKYSKFPHGNKFEVIDPNNDSKLSFRSIFRMNLSAAEVKYIIELMENRRKTTYYIDSESDFGWSIIPKAIKGILSGRFLKDPTLLNDLNDAVDRAGKFYHKVTNVEKE